LRRKERKELKEKVARCNAFSHAAPRAKWRYDVTLKYKQYKILYDRIKNRSSGVEFLWEVSKGRSAWRIEYRAASRPLVAIWDEKAEVIVTFLPIADLKRFMPEKSKENAG